MCICLTVFVSCSTNQTNLLINADAELPKFDSVPIGWTNVKGNWVSAEGDSAKHDFGFAQHSSRYFFAGYGLLCTLQQDVDVSSFANKIDAQKQHFVLSGYEQTLDQGKISDQGVLKMACLDASKNKILFSFQSDTLMSISKWQPVTDTFLAPADTRFIRVQLVSIRNVGGDNDGYFDNISLVAQSSFNYLFILIPIVVLVLLLLIWIYKKALSEHPKVNFF